MPAPVIGFYTGSNSVFGTLASQYDFGTIATGSSGSTQNWFIFNNFTTGSSVSDATSVSISVHDQGVSNHQTQTSFAPVSGSGLPWTWVYVRGLFVYNWNGTATGSGTGVSDTSFVGVYSGSLNALTKAQVNSTIQGSQGLGGTSGSVWSIQIFAGIPNTVSQGQKSGSVCIKYNYV